MVGIYSFAFQIFCDFAGYSNIARGLGKVMGFDIMINFNLPYFATNPREFWRRWHISLSTWLKDYLYISLGGNRKGGRKTYRNIAITMLLGGLWHGAAWTFVIWGAYHGTILVIHRIFSPLFKIVPSTKDAFTTKVWLFVKIIFFFHLICIGWLIFRSQSVIQAFQMLHGLFLNFDPTTVAGIGYMVFRMMFFITLLLIVQMFQYWKDDLMVVYKSNPVVKAVFYFICFYLLILLGAGGGEKFIYFQF